MFRALGQAVSVLPGGSLVGRTFCTRVLQAVEKWARVWFGA